MRSARVTMVVGFLLLLAAGSFLVAGSVVDPRLALAAGVLGATLLIVGLFGRRTKADPPTNRAPARSRRLLRLVAVGLTGLGLLALLVAIVVAEGEARGHAMGHLLMGFLCVGLFAALAFPWHPPAGGGAAGLRGLVLIVLAAAASGAFMESLGGAGYDAANAGHRIEALTTLHRIAVPFGALPLGAVPLAMITGFSLLLARAIRHHRIRPTP